MDEQIDSSTPITRNAKRRQGQRLSAEERKEVQRVFLDSFKLNANVTLACIQAGIDRSMVYRWQEHDETFTYEFKQAEKAANDVLLAAAWQRGVGGVEKPVVSMGKQVFVSETINGQVVAKPLMERVYSDALLSLLMRARMPEYREKQTVDVNNISGTPGTIPISTKDLTNEELALLKHIALRQKAQQGEI